jgi:hypothetical protein
MTSAQKVTKKTQQRIVDAFQNGMPKKSSIITTTTVIMAKNAKRSQNRANHQLTPQHLNSATLTLILILTVLDLETNMLEFK